jgi:hypothetical protein
MVSISMGCGMQCTSQTPSWWVDLLRSACHAGTLPAGVLPLLPSSRVHPRPPHSPSSRSSARPAAPALRPPHSARRHSSAARPARPIAGSARLSRPWVGSSWRFSPLPARRPCHPHPSASASRTATRQLSSTHTTAASSSCSSRSHAAARPQAARQQSRQRRQQPWLPAHPRPLATCQLHSQLRWTARLWHVPSPCGGSHWQSQRPETSCRSSTGS